jgi:hypothetical protein
MKPVHKLKRHAFPVNAISWAPHSDIHIATAGTCHVKGRCCWKTRIVAMVWCGRKTPFVVNGFCRASVLLEGPYLAACFMLLGAAVIHACLFASLRPLGRRSGEDMNAFIWNLESQRFADSGDPLLEYCAGGCINNMLWSESQPDWLSIAFDDTVQILLV